MPAWIVRVLLMFVLLLAAAGIAAPLSVGARFIGPLSEAAGCPVISVVPADTPAETCGPGGASIGALAQSTATSIPTPTTTPAPSSGPGVLWHADHETGDFSQWTANYGGGTYNSGNGVASISTDFAHSGSYSAALSLTTNGVDSEAVRIFRWNESRDPRYPDLYYSVWYYFPTQFKVIGNRTGPDYWNVFQWKSKRYIGPNEETDPTWVLNVGNRSNGAMFFYLYDEIRNISYTQNLVDVPTGRWLHVEAFLHRATDKSGHLAFWQDEAQIYDINEVQTSLGGELQWSVDSYSHALSPNAATIYIDDAAISTRRIGP